MSTAAVVVHVAIGALGREPPGVRRDADGRPSLPDRSVSISDSGSLMVVATGPPGRRVGVDVEHVRPRRDLAGLARRTMTDAELAAWLETASAQQLVAFHRHWTRLEAGVKATGRGLAAGLRWRPPPHWTVVDLAVPDGYAAALVVDAPSVEVVLSAGGGA